MWPIVMAVLRRNAVYLTLPFAAIVGVIGYNIENLISDKYTPYSPSIQDNRADRLADDDVLANAAKVDKLKLKENVLGRNLSPSLQGK
ncbi:Small integral membrane protein 12-A [Pseudolycoriella hygida]|uniref:Small integral membrane protein 12-A n=1 Tax=Pseudolycoriella hygida TaxID=35572 RepID=A0A9Q0N5V9_9DIPT|nr:Small integral membrane protein 12-A [Pseudolycoriella hygida]